MNAKIDRDCTVKCKSKQHANELCSVISKRGVTDNEICAYLNWKCYNCGQNFDSAGRTALHFAASCGRKVVVQWLLKKGALINAKDLESGYTPLHRSIFYGKINCAVSLIQLGANLHALDNNDLTPLEHALKDRKNTFTHSQVTPCQVYVWGTNTNYTLGTGFQQSRQQPEILDAFHKKYPNVSVKQVCLDKFHFVLVSMDGRVFSCGNGFGGRLGLTTENIVLEPQELKFNQNGVPSFVCVEASIGRDHSLFLSESGHVWSCGLNTHHVLGIKPPPPQIVVPRPLGEFKNPEGSKIIGVCASRFHSVAWGSNCLYTWGLHAGQLGHPDSLPNKTFITPKLVSSFTSICMRNINIKSVATSEGATVVAMDQGDVYILSEYKIRKIATKLNNIIKIVCIGGTLNSKVSSDIINTSDSAEPKVLILTAVGNILYWKPGEANFIRCIYSFNRSIVIKDVALNRSEVLLITDDGAAYRGEFRQKINQKKKEMKEVEKGDFIELRSPKSSNKMPQNFHEFLEKSNCQLIKVTKLPHIHRAAKIQSDIKGRNYAVLQIEPRFDLINIPYVSESTLSEDMRNLLTNSDEMDCIHDALFKVGTKLFPVHHYLIALKCENLDCLIKATAPDEPIELSNIHPLIFEQVLLYIYTGTCDLLQCKECPLNLRNLETTNDIKNNNNESFENDIIDENISAFVYYSNKKTKDKTKNKKTIPKTDAVRLLQQAGNRFGLKDLSRKLDSLTIVDGWIRPKVGKNTVKVGEKRLLDRNFKKMYDVVVKAKKGEEILAHKCILAARLEYFNNIFAVRWNMSSSRKEIMLPIPYSILQHIVEFLYTDECKILENNTDIDFICSLLIVSDQLFIERLKEQCEVALNTLLTLKNASQMLQLAFIYNAPQLKLCVMEFICLNISALLEIRSLESLDDDILDELTNFYCEWNDNLSKRVITPYSDAPSDEAVKSVSEIFPIVIKSDDSDQENDVKTPNKSAKKKRTRKISENNRNKSKETEYVFTESNETVKETIIEFETPKPDEKWLKILSEKEKHQKIVQARLKAATSAKGELLNNPLISDNFTKLTRTSVKNISQERSPNSSPIQSPSSTFSPLQSPNSSFMDFPNFKLPLMNQIPIQKNTKLSQKQRKKCMLESFSLDEQMDPVIKKTDELKMNECLSPKNPWKKLDAPIQEPVQEKKQEAQNFADIMQDEKKQRDNWTKMKAKPLKFIEMEDRAIEELIRFYNADNQSDEYITIHRVETGAYSAPLWVQANKSTK